MPKILWDQVGTKVYETGVDHGVLYIPDNTGVYNTGFPWNGLTAVTESPSGAEVNPQYADNIKYINLQSPEEFGGTIEAFTAPDAFGVCDGTAAVKPGVYFKQQARKTFGLSYRTLVGNDIEGVDFGYKLHLVYGALAMPSEKAYSTVNDSPEGMPLSWEFSTTPVAATGFRPLASLVIDSTKVSPTDLAALELILYGTSGATPVEPLLPLPDDVAQIFATAI